jgi:predicted nucleic acid-binding protein
MPAGLILIDTDVLIDYSRGIKETKEILSSLESNYILAISVVTQLELMVGCENKADFNSLQKFLSNFEIIQLSKSTSEKTVDLFEKYRLSHGVLIPDMLIASTALTLKIPLLSKNRKDFRFIKKLNLFEYTT